MPGHWVAASELHPHDLIRLDSAPLVELTTVSTTEVVQVMGWAHDDPYRRTVTATYRPREQVWRIYCPALSCQVMPERGPASG